MAKKSKVVLPRELKGEPIAVEYDPPTGLSPIELGALLDRHVDMNDLSSVIIDLAVRGYLKIRYVVLKIRFWPDKRDFELERLKDGSDLVSPAEKIIFEFLFGGRNTVRLSDLEKQTRMTSFLPTLRNIQKSTEDYLLQKGYFDLTAKNRAKNLKIILIILSVLIFIGLLLSNIVSLWLGFSLFLLSAVIVSILSVKIARLSYKFTPEGLSVLKKILGFKEFLQLTEGEKLRLLNAPSLQPEIFEKFLPYAMALGVEDKWAKKFEGIYNTKPAWYEDPSAASFNSYMLTSQLAVFNNSFNQVLTVSTSRSGISSGYSGGGSGGGGGGSW